MNYLQESINKNKRLKLKFNGQNLYDHSLPFESEKILFMEEIRQAKSSFGFIDITFRFEFKQDSGIAG